MYLCSVIFLVVNFIISMIVTDTNSLSMKLMGQIIRGEENKIEGNNRILFVIFRPNE